ARRPHDGNNRHDDIYKDQNDFSFCHADLAKGWRIYPNRRQKPMNDQAAPPRRCLMSVLPQISANSVPRPAALWPAPACRTTFLHFAAPCTGFATAALDEVLEALEIAFDATRDDTE